MGAAISTSFPTVVFDSTSTPVVPEVSGGVTKSSDEQLTITILNIPSTTHDSTVFFTFKILIINLISLPTLF